MLAILKFLINPLFITGNIYSKMLRLQAYSNTQKKYFFIILDCTK